MVVETALAVFDEMPMMGLAVAVIEVVEELTDTMPEAAPPMLELPPVVELIYAGVEVEKGVARLAEAAPAVLDAVPAVDSTQVVVDELEYEATEEAEGPEVLDDLPTVMLTKVVVKLAERGIDKDTEAAPAVLKDSAGVGMM